MSKQNPIGKVLLEAWEESALPEGKTAFLRADLFPELNAVSAAKHWHFEQSFAPYADTLKNVGYAAESSLFMEEGSYDCVLVFATRFAEENRHLLARAWGALKVGGVLVVAQHNDLGAKRLDSLLKSIGTEYAVLTKHHCRALSARKVAGTIAPVDWLQALAPVAVAGAPLQAAPGMFSWRRVDAGSALLADALPQDFSGHGADIAAGWGYLSWRLLESQPGISTITLYEAEKQALDMARVNLSAHPARTRFHWCDAAKPLPAIPAGGFDWAVMNPPAHDLSWSAPEMTAAMFTQAADALKPNGTLWLVAGRQLPYEELLQKRFKSVQKLLENADFKLIKAQK